MPDFSRWITPELIQGTHMGAADLTEVIEGFFLELAVGAADHVDRQLELFDSGNPTNWP